MHPPLPFRRAVRSCRTHSSVAAFAPRIVGLAVAAAAEIFDEGTAARAGAAPMIDNGAFPGGEELLLCFVVEALDCSLDERGEGIAGSNLQTFANLVELDRHTGYFGHRLLLLNKSVAGAPVNGVPPMISVAVIGRVRFDLDDAIARLLPFIASAVLPFYQIFDADRHFADVG